MLDGGGTEDDPYKIATAADLLEFADKVNNKNQTSAWAELTANIDLNNQRWTPIGSDSHPYTGTFDGNGHTISGLYLDSSSANYQGLFGYVGTGGTVKDFSVSGTVSGGMFVGGVVGLNRGSVENCTNTGSVTSSVSPVGGVVGRNDGSVENCYNTGNVSGNSVISNVGGVVGDSSGTVKNCYNTGSVSGGMYVGGVVGLNSRASASVTNCYNTGTVTGPDSGSDSYVGGVVGSNSFSATVTDCYNTGNVSGPDSVNGETIVNVGGVVGSNSFSATVTDCYNTGTVTGPVSASGNNSVRVGGVVGNNSFSASVTNCYNTGEVSGLDSGSVSGKIIVGGVVGYNFSSDGNVTGCYFLQQGELQGIGDGVTDGQTATSVTTLGELCDALASDTNTWSISPFCKHPVLQANPEGGDGTKEHPYEIKTAAQLETFRDIVNGANEQVKDSDAHAKLMNDINLSSVCSAEEGSWTPIGNSIGNSYEGTFNGDGHTISGLYIDSSDVDYKGLFGRVNGGTVQDLSVSGDINGNRYVGGVVGYNNGGTVTGCAFSGSVSGKISVGGVVGENSGSNGVVENCHNAGKVSGSNTVGGVVGGNDSGTVTNCTNTGNLSGPDSVNGSADSSNVGGVVGDNRGSVENCYNTGSVSGDWYVGGVVGYNHSGTVKNCYNTGEVSGPDNGTSNYVGGVVGWNRSSVTNCYNTGSVSDGTYTGGVVGWNDGANVTNCYFLKTADVNENLSGIGKNEGTSSNVEARTDDAFHSGEVAWLLENGQAEDQTTPVWGQSNLNTDKSWPTLVALDKNAKTVYQVTLKYDHAGAQDKTYYTNDPAEPAAPARDGYTFGGWDKTGEGTTTITYTAKWTAEEPPYTGKYSYEVFTSVGDNGTVTVDRYATEGDTVTIQVTPDQAYKLDELVVTANGKDVELTAGGDGTYSFTMPSADVRITATFAEDPDWTEPEPEPEPSTDVSDLFIDIAPDAWYKDAVQYAYDHGLMTGVSDTEFAPEATTTRAMIVSILARLEGVTTAQAAGFADVDDEWYATAVNWAASVGVVNGYEDNTFRPNTAITREQLAAILMNYAVYKGEDVSNRADLTSYTDQPSTWATETMSWAVAEGLINGVTNTELQPQGNATRAQVAAILQRFLDK